MRTCFLILITFLSAHLTFAQTTAQEPFDSKRRILVLSGGGARGAWGGGLSQSLCQKFGYKYEYVVGNSTGSLLAPLVTISEFARLKEAYTGIKQKDIFNGNGPFKTKGSKKGEIRVGNAFWKVLFGSKTLGKTDKLRRTIERFYTEDMHRQIQSREDREFIATVLNFSLDQIEYKSSEDYDYQQMVDWMWASANQPVFMSLYQYKGNGNYYIDGGSKENVPILKATELALQHNIRNIDVIVHNTEKPRIEPTEDIKVLSSLFRTINILTNDVKENDLFWAKMISDLEQQLNMFSNTDSRDVITITIYFMSEEETALIPNVLLFEKDKMSELWRRGENFFEQDVNTQNDHSVIYKIPVGGNRL